MGKVQTRVRWHQNTRHHRCPRRWGGATCRENIVILKRWEHDAWHRLVNHQYPTSIAQQFNTWDIFKGYTVVAVRVGDRFPDLTEHAYGADIILAEMTRVQLRTWHTLRRVWESRSVSTGCPTQVMAYITKRYLHPDFALCAYPLFTEPRPG